MKILKAKYLRLCDEKFTILQDKSVVFDEKIIEICEFKEALKKYPNSQIYDFSNDIVLPAFINTHTHLEFSANATTLIYGDFIKWVGSIVKSRSKLSKKATQNLIAKQIKIMQKSGVGTIGEISSFGIEAEICAKSGARFVFFNEVLGANESVVEANFANFMARFENSQKFKSDMFIPAVSVHSPYSTHEKLTKKVCEFARRENLIVSTHFLESSHEKKWLESGTGEFKKWLSNFNKNPKPFYTPSEFIAHFKGIKTLFTHCVWANEFDE
ncbi:MAG: metal-dependent hydrolase, partial [Campylobacter sp.]|nr:metal-dependent hydrolase [Campylobacter sp.]